MEMDWLHGDIIEGDVVLGDVGEVLGLEPGPVGGGGVGSEELVAEAEVHGLAESVVVVRLAGVGGVGLEVEVVGREVEGLSLS